MTVNELIWKLQRCPQHLKVKILYDGNPCLTPNCAYLGNINTENIYGPKEIGLILCDKDEVCLDEINTEFIFEEIKK